MGDLDSVLVRIGSRYQVLTWTVLALMNCFPSCFIIFSYNFIAYQPEHHCQVEYANESVPETNDKTVNQCQLALNSTLNSTSYVDCPHGHWYSKDPISSTVISEWDLVCDKSMYTTYLPVIHGMGEILGALLCGVLGDTIGRKKTYFGCGFIMAICSVVVIFSPNIYFMMAIKFVLGAMCTAVNFTGFILATELFPPKQRVVYSTSHEFVWAAGIMLTPVIGYFIRDWRPYLMAIGFPMLLIFPAYFIIPESVPWLIAQGRLVEAEATLQKVAKFNKVHLEARCLRDYQPDGVQACSNEKYTLLDLFRTCRMAYTTLCVTVLFFSNSMAYYGVQFYTAKLDDKIDFYLLYFIMATVEQPSTLISLASMYWLGRRPSLIGFHILAGLCTGLVPFMSNYYEAQVAVLICAKMFITAAFTVVYVYTPELFPTTLRNSGMGIGSLLGRIGTILTPFVLVLDDMGPYGPYYTLVTYGAVMMSAGFMGIALNETNKRPLPRTVSDCQNYTQYCDDIKREKETNKLARALSARKDDTEKIALMGLTDAADDSKIDSPDTRNSKNTIST